MGKPTTKDLAKAAGVSLATVDRVLNARAGVRQATVDRVQKAIREINYVRDLAAADLARRKEYNLVFVLPEHDDEYVRQIEDAITEANVSLIYERTQVSILHAPANDPHQVALILDSLLCDRTDGVAIMAPETPQVRDAISRLEARGIDVVALVSSQPTAKSADYVGINNKAAGRTAAQLVGRFTAGRSGRVLVLTETMQGRDSQERRLGFDQVIAAFAPRLQVLPSMETYGDPARTARIIKRALQNQPSIVGIYLMNHEIRDAMQAIRTQTAVIVGHELTPHARACLLDGTMDALISQDVGHLVRSSIRLLRAKATRRETVASQERIRIEIILRENMPD